MAHYVFDDQSRAFERQIDMLLNKGNFVATNEALEMLRGDAPVDGNYFHLSFDDGLDCLARNAAPVLDAAGVQALVFVNSALAGTPIPEERTAWELATNYAAPLKVMSWETLAQTGFEVGAHTRTHARLVDISVDQQRLEREILGCKIEIETALGRPCRYFAWPFGRRNDIDEKSLAVIRSSGFEAAFSAFRAPVKPGLTDPLMIPRHHFEPQWPLAHLRFFALGGMGIAR
jgi:peptidoglycan/xylan/chitin deacetylase (PgdA/CDA1 family)